MNGTDGVEAVDGGQHVAPEPVRIFGVAHGGAGVGRRVSALGRDDGETLTDSDETRTWLVEGGLPGEVVMVRRTRSEKRLIRGAVVEVATASDERVAPPCALASVCGGCNWQHVAPGAQLGLKRKIVEGQLRRLPNVNVELAPSGPALGYRRRARLHFRRDGDGLQLGFHRPRSRELVNVETCPVLEPALDHALQRVRRLAALLPERGEVVGLSDGAQVVVGLPGVRPTPALEAAARGLLDDTLVGITLRGGRARVTVGRAALEIDGPGAGDGPVAGRISPFVFAQAQRAVNEELVRHVVQEAAPAGRRVLELYAGAGNFTRALAARARRVWAIDEHREALASLRELVQRVGLPVATRASKVETLLGKLARGRGADGPKDAGRWDVVVLDPPRRGLGRQAARGLCALTPGRIVYVSCDPATLARDLEIFVGAGYAITRVRAFDLMPMTSEVEIVVTLVRGGADAGGRV